MSDPLQQARLYWESIRRMHPGQILGRLTFQTLRPRPDRRPAPEMRCLDRSKWIVPPGRRPIMSGPDEYVLLNETRRLAGRGWDHPQVPRLWRYHLHYFDDLNAERAAERKAWHIRAIADWIVANPPGMGTGWEPYPTSLRIVNWVKWAMAGNRLDPEALHSLAVQVRWIRQRLEWHLRGNHLLVNAKALIFAGCFFTGKEAEQWLGYGFSMLRRELKEQILGDGGHFELSPMYHALILEDLLDLANMIRAAGIADRQAEDIARLAASVAPMIRWLDTMCHPDGGIGFFNDAAFGISLTRQALRHHAQALGFRLPDAPGDGLTHLASSGYARLQFPHAVLLVDLAEIGPNAQPGHGHADTLSFELSVKGHRLLVNSGTSQYETGPERLRQRGTRAHNTVEVDLADSSEVWSSFRVARRARPIGLHISKKGDGWRIECSHDGYVRLPGPAVHHRCWLLAAHRLTVRDGVNGNYRRAEARFHFHPGWTCNLSADGRSGRAVQGPITVHWETVRGFARLRSSSWHPEFGLSLPSCLLETELEDGESETTFHWEGG